MYACQIFSVVSDSCPVIDSRSPDSSVRGTLQARMCADCAVMSDFATPWTVAYQAPQSMEFSRQQYWSGVPLPTLIFWPREFHELYSPWDCNESETTERLSLHFTAGVQPRWIQGIRSMDGVGVRKTYLFIDIRLD